MPWRALVRSWRFWVALVAVWLVGIGIGAATPPEDDEADTETAATDETTTTEEAETTTTEEAETTTTEEPTTTTEPPTTAPPTTPPPPPPGPATTFGDGTFVVNEDIAPGTYRTEGGEHCYWERLSGFGGSFEEIVANDLPTGPSLVTIAPTDVGFTSEGCGTWVPAG